MKIFIKIQTSSIHTLCVYLPYIFMDIFTIDNSVTPTNCQLNTLVANDDLHHCQNIAITVNTCVIMPLNPDKKQSVVHELCNF